VEVRTDLENELPLKPYLLGELRPEDQQSLEQRLMIDTAVFEELQRVEDELIDDYLRGCLSGREQEKFENFFLLPPERRQKLSFAKALRRYVADHAIEERQQPAWLESLLAFFRLQIPVPSWSLAAALLVIIAGGSWSVIEFSRLRRILEQASSQNTLNQLIEMQTRNQELAAAFERERNQRSRLEQEMANLKPGEKPGHPSPPPSQLQPALLSFALTPGLLRDMGINRKINIPAGAKVVQFHLTVAPEDYPKYHAALQSVEGNEVWSQTWLRAEATAQGEPLQLILPAKRLTPGDYVMKLSGITASGESEDAGKYYFRVIQK
jgi:hypothetical protein